MSSLWHLLPRGPWCNFAIGESPAGEKGDKGEAVDSNPKSDPWRQSGVPTGPLTNGWQSGPTDRRPSALKNTRAAERTVQDELEGPGNWNGHVHDPDPYPYDQVREE